jgi:hypothetical protein
MGTFSLNSRLASEVEVLLSEILTFSEASGQAFEDVGISKKSTRCLMKRCLVLITFTECLPFIKLKL